MAKYSNMVDKLKFMRKIKSTLIVTSTGMAIFTGFNLYRGNEKFYDELLMPLMHLIDPEVVHKIAVTGTKWGILSTQKLEDPASLRTTVWGLQFSNPIGMAAGFDKHAEAVQGLQKMGFGFVEIGSVTPKPQFGNVKPRVFRLKEDRAIINRYGFNSEGHEVVRKRLQSLRANPNFSGIIGVNLGINKTTEDSTKDYIDGLKTFCDVADYFVINISSPNTPGLRNLQNKENLKNLLLKVNEARLSCERRPPLLVKLSLDLSGAERQDIADVIKNPKCKVDGLVISNTTIQRINLKSPDKSEIGGVSGAPLTDLSTSMIADMFKRTNGAVPIIGVGGVFSGKDAYDKIKAGASLVQIYTAYTYHGPPIINRIKKELISLIEKDGHASFVEAIGKNTNI